jgi:hypothetical protein
MHKFSLVGEVFLYFILQVVVVEIQISLQITNRFGKRKGIFNINIGCGPKPGRKPSPTQHPTPTLARPSRSSVAQPARPRPRSVKRSQSRGSRPHDAAPGRARLANPDPDPNLAGVRSCLPRTPPQRPVSFPRTTTTKSKREKLSPMKPIMEFSPNPQQTRHKSSIRLEGISGTMLRPCWTLWPTNRSTRAPPQTLFPIAPCQLEACRAEPSPEGGCPSRSAAAGADSRAGAPPEDAPTAVEDRPSRLCIASFPPSVSTTVSEQNEFLSTSRSRRSRQFIKWGPIGRGGAGRAIGYGVTSPVPCLAGAR